ncbi:3-isopropylmalate dehydratase small subunit [Actinomadura bangladeshensis]|uniref:3-isopropylmalate dehydratase small subunit n=1 Tax=Actinomadura bangladeshensis TaxID=453573 RepID=A0A6L9QXT0_9ACTN|nr:3-isopropylmalate dehydratase small subunit [Actinomadura bangladeshensis]NEA29948.1 3-isopropylmalate dehydratase small subunit [Actinomadura bangladeshensis]
MEPVTVVTGRAVPLDRGDVDTDQIIPARWMKRVERTGYADGLFEKWRRDPDFVLNRPEYRGGTILVGGPNFGCGSSREHAPWALRDYGFRAIVAPGFADIFRGNLPNSGLVPVQVAPEIAAALLAAATADPATEIVIDVVERSIGCPAAGVHDSPFQLDDSAHHRLVNGLDEIDLTLSRNEAVTAYERTRSPWLPTGRP